MMRDPAENFAAFVVREPGKPRIASRKSLVTFFRFATGDQRFALPLVAPRRFGSRGKHGGDIITVEASGRVRRAERAPPKASESGRLPAPRSEATMEPPTGLSMISSPGEEFGIRKLSHTAETLRWNVPSALGRAHRGDVGGCDHRDSV